jgi:hypothetical protein
MGCVWSEMPALGFIAPRGRRRLVPNCRHDPAPNRRSVQNRRAEKPASSSRSAPALRRLKRLQRMGATWAFVAAFVLAFVRVVSAQTTVPGETEATRIEDIYYEQGPQLALEALMQDYSRALGGPGPRAGRQQIDDEISRLEAHTTRYTKYSPLVAIATQWCLERHDGRRFPLQYGELLPTSGTSPDAAVPDGELDREMIKVLQNNWTNYANLTRSRTRGYVIDERQIPLEFDALRKDQSDQEDVRVAAKNLSGKQRAPRP